MKTALTFDDVNSAFLPHSELERLLAFLENENIRATLFAIPHGLLDGGRDYSQLVQRAHRSGHEVALHGYSHSRNEFGYIFPIPWPTYEKQRELLSKGRDELTKFLGEEPLGFRAPNYRHNRTTLRALKDLGFKYDSSKTVFKPTHGIRFRVKTGIRPKVMDLGGILEIPVTADYSFSTADVGLAKRLEIARKDFDWAKETDGTFVINNHVDSVKAVVFEFLHSLIKNLRTETDFVRLRDLIQQPSKD